MKLTVAYCKGLETVSNKQDTDFKMQAVLKSVRKVPLLKKPGLRNAACCSYGNVFQPDTIRGTEQLHTRFVAFSQLEDA